MTTYQASEAFHALNRITQPNFRRITGDQTLLRAVLLIKRQRGDTDCDDFKSAARQLTYGLNTTVGVAYRTMTAIAKAQRGNRSVRVTYTFLPLSIIDAFLADLEDIAQLEPA